MVPASWLGQQLPARAGWAKQQSPELLLALEQRHVLSMQPRLQ
jgi:hypothetical protein